MPAIRKAEALGIMAAQLRQFTALQRTQGQFPHPDGGLQRSESPVLGDQTPFSGFCHAGKTPIYKEIKLKGTNGSRVVDCWPILVLKVNKM